MAVLNAGQVKQSVDYIPKGGLVMDYRGNIWDRQ